MSTSTVKVISIDLKQTSIKVHPSKQLVQILEDACEKFKLNPDKYLLKHKEKELDLSNTFRNSGLVPGAKLELITKSKSPAVLNIALHLPEAEAKLQGAPRVTAKLPSDYTVWKVLRHFESVECKGKGVNITGRGVPQTNSGGNSGQLYYETPSLQIESRTLSTFVDFQTTMSRLGYNKGSVLIRLSFQKTDRTFMDATQDISQYFEEEEAVQQERQAAAAPAPEKIENEAPSNTGDTPTVPDAQPGTTQEPQVEEPATAEPEPDPMDVDSAASDPLAPVSIFSAPKNSTPAAAQTQDSDEIYAPSIAHAQLHQQRLKNESQNKRLLSDKELQEKANAEAAKLASIKSVDIRVRFPDMTQAQWKATPDWTGLKLYTAVRGVMAHETQRFRLVRTGVPPMTINDTNSTTLIKGYGLRHNELVNLVWDDSVPADVRKQPFLKQAARGQATEIEIPEVPQGEPEDEPSGPSAPRLAPSRNENGDGKKKGGMPKWLKLGKK